MLKKLVTPILASALILTACAETPIAAPTRHLASGDYFAAGQKALEHIDSYISFETNRADLLLELAEISYRVDFDAVSGSYDSNYYTAKAIERAAGNSDDISELKYYRDQLAYYTGADMLYLPHSPHYTAFDDASAQAISDFCIPESYVTFSYSNDGYYSFNLGYACGANKSAIVNDLPSAIDHFRSDPSSNNLIITLECFNDSIGSLVIIDGFKDSKFPGQREIIVQRFDSDGNMKIIYEDLFGNSDAAAIEAFASCAFD